MGKICGIYYIENLVNHKKYVGQSTDIKARIRKHKSELRKNKHKNVHLQSAWNKYGEDNFSFYTLEECSFEELDEREVYYISTMDLTNQNNGYNIELGGFTNKTMSDETKDKISKSLKGRVFTEEHRQRIGQANIGRVVSEETRRKMRENHVSIRGENNPNYGKHHTEEAKKKMRENRRVIRGEEHHNYGKKLSEETKKKLSEAHKGIHAGNKHPRCRPVYCPELNEKFWGAAEVEQKYGIDRTYIYACLSGKQKSAGKHPVTGEKLHWLDANDVNNTKL